MENINTDLFYGLLLGVGVETLYILMGVFLAKYLKGHNSKCPCCKRKFKHGEEVIRLKDRLFCHECAKEIQKAQIEYSENILNEIEQMEGELNVTESN